VTLTLNGSTMSFGMALGAGLGGLVLAEAGYFVLGVCTLALPLAAAVFIGVFRLVPERKPG
jgi:predicted MFS family arabinose efflux permease